MFHSKKIYSDNVFFFLFLFVTHAFHATLTIVGHLDLFASITSLFFFCGESIVAPNGDSVSFHFLAWVQLILQKKFFDMSCPCS